MPSIIFVSFTSLSFLVGIGMIILRLRFHSWRFTLAAPLFGFLGPLLIMKSPEKILIAVSFYLVGLALGYFVLRNRITPAPDPAAELIKEIRSRVRNGSMVVVDDGGNPIQAEDVLKDFGK